MEAYNEQQLSMCETKDLVEYISELRVENDDVKEAVKVIEVLKDASYDIQKKNMEALKEKNKKLQAEIDKLKEQIEAIGKLTDKKIDEVVSSTPAIMKLYGDIASLITTIKGKDEEIEKLKNPVIPDRDSRCCQFDIRVGYSYIMDCLESVLLDEELDHFHESDYQEKADFVCEEVARAIDSAINGYIRNPVGQLEYHIMDKVRDKVEVLRHSGHIYEEYPAEKDD